MEDVLDVYKRPRDPKRPLVCLDEASKQLLAETREPLAMKKGRPARSDYEYKRNGTANLFMVFAPLEGRRHVKVTDRRTAVDYARRLEESADCLFADAEKIILLQDNLNTHKPASLYEVFPPEKARRLVERFEWHIPPNTEAGSTWPSPSWAFCPINVLTAVSRINRCSPKRLKPGKPIATNIAAKPIGSSQPQTPALSSDTCTRLFR
jgi:hypothetical protein